MTSTTGTIPMCPAGGVGGSALFLLSVALLGCGTKPPPSSQHAASRHTDDRSMLMDPAAPEAGVRPPPASSQVVPFTFPQVETVELANGLRVDLIATQRSPAAHVRLVIGGGKSTDPADRAGVATLATQLMREGTRRHTGPQLAEQIERLGADMAADADADNAYVVLRTPARQLQPSLRILHELLTEPVFREEALRRTVAEHQERLSLDAQRPELVAQQSILEQLYGDHTYGARPPTPRGLGQIRRVDLIRWHRRYVVPRNSHLIIAGQIDVERTKRWIEELFGTWSGGVAAEANMGEIASDDDPPIVVINRPGATHAVLLIGAVTVGHNHSDFLSLLVANQLLGGDPSARLPRELRQARAMAYTTYSVLAQRRGPAPLLATATVETERAAEALNVMFRAFDELAQTAPSREAVAGATRRLATALAMELERPGDLASLIGAMRSRGLGPDDWNGYHEAILAVSAEQVAAAAQRHITAARRSVAVVGDAASIVQHLRRWGAVEVVDQNGEPQQRFDALEQETGN